MYVCVFVFSQSLWLRAPMDEWLDSLPCESEDPSSNPDQRSFFFFVLFFFLLFYPIFVLFLFLFGRADICAAELATWVFGPDVYTPQVRE